MPRSAFPPTTCAYAISPAITNHQAAEDCQQGSTVQPENKASAQDKRDTRGRFLAHHRDLTSLDKYCPVGSRLKRLARSEKTLRAALRALLTDTKASPSGPQMTKGNKQGQDTPQLRVKAPPDARQRQSVNTQAIHKECTTSHPARQTDHPRSQKSVRQANTARQPRRQTRRHAATDRQTVRQPYRPNNWPPTRVTGPNKAPKALRTK